MLAQFRVDAIPGDVDLKFGGALAAARNVDPLRLSETMNACRHCSDTLLLMDLEGENPLEWRYVGQHGVDRLKAWTDSGPVVRVGDVPDQTFARDVLIPTYVDAIRIDRPVVHRVTAIANRTFLSYRKLTVLVPARDRKQGNGHMLVFSQVDQAIPLDHSLEQPPSLTSRERHCLTLVAGGLSAKQVAREMGISEKTVELHLSRVRTKYGARTTAQAIAISMALTLAA